MGVQMLVKGDEEFLNNDVMGDLAGEDMDRCFFVKWVPFLNQAPQCTLGIGAFKQRAVGTPLHASKENVKIGLEPNRHAGIADCGAGIGVRERAAAGGDDRWASGYQTLDHAAFAGPEELFAILLEDLFDARIGGFFDLSVGVLKGDVEANGKPLTDGALAGAHHPDKDDRSAAKFCYQLTGTRRWPRSFGLGGFFEGHNQPVLNGRSRHVKTKARIQMDAVPNQSRNPVETSLNPLASWYS